MFEPKLRKSGEEWNIGREEFQRRFHKIFDDPIFEHKENDIQQLCDIAFAAYEEGRKSPNTRKAGPEFSDPNYDLSVDWIKTKMEIDEAQRLHEDPQGPGRVLVICASDRNENTCPGEMSKSLRLAKLAANSFESEGLTVDFLNLSHMTSEYGKNIYPCKGCVSTAMPLCHWPCSCYPNHSLGQVHDWMNDIYPMWVRAHGVMIITPVYWHQAPSALKLMIDRLVCADGGNPDPTTTQGKNAEKAKKLERQGWSYPRHLEGRVFSLVVHGDTMGVDDVKNALTSWLTEINLIPASTYGVIGRYIGYFGTYADSHKELDKDHALMDEVRIAAEALALSITSERTKKYASLVPHFNEPRPK